MDLGIDSLMAVELRNRLATGLALAKPLTATLVFDFPTIADIAGHLNAIIEPPQAAHSNGRPSRSSSSSRWKSRISTMTASQRSLMRGCRNLEVS